MSRTVQSVHRQGIITRGQAAGAARSLDLLVFCEYIEPPVMAAPEWKNAHWTEPGFGRERLRGRVIEPLTERNADRDARRCGTSSKRPYGALRD